MKRDLKWFINSPYCGSSLDSCEDIECKKCENGYMVIEEGEDIFRGEFYYCWNCNSCSHMVSISGTVDYMQQYDEDNDLWHNIETTDDYMEIISCNVYDQRISYDSDLHSITYTVDGEDGTIRYIIKDVTIIDLDEDEDEEDEE